MHRPAPQPQPERRSAPKVLYAKAAEAAPAAKMPVPKPRQFRLPPDARVHALVKQTLVQMDLPPNLMLKHQVPLPTLLLWNAPVPPPMQKFVAPPIRRVEAKAGQSLPKAPALTLPNREVTPAELNIASAVTTQMPKLVRYPSVASPVSRPGKEPAPEIPQIGAAQSAQPSPADLISLPAKPLRATSLLVLPPANQIAPTDAANAGPAKGGTTGAGAGGQRTVAKNAAGPSGSTAGSLRNELAASAAAKLPARPAVPAATGQWTATGTPGVLTEEPKLAGATRIDLPKEGKFGVVVLGSATAAAYPETVGALSGKVVYTVYLKVGLRKSWILQYCLAKGTSGQSTVPVEAPWPFLIMRPDEWSASDPDYIIMHGTLTAAGKFEHLAMVYPDELDKKELLLKSLKLWAFRPASRDGVPVSVEVLLIIPREVE